MDPLRVAAVQFEHAPSDKSANLAVIERFTAQAAARSAALVLFPECCITGYWHLRKLSRDELAELAEPVPAGPSSRRLIELAGDHKLTVGAGLIERADDGRMFNSFVVAMPDGGTVCHRKIHAFISEHVDCGERITVFDGPGGWRTGLLTCYDNNLVENVRLAALAGAKLILAPHQTGGCRSRSPHAMGLVDRALWENRSAGPAARDAIEAELRGEKGRGWILRWLPSRAHDNGVFYVFANGVGVDDDEVRTGNAMILDCYGRILAETSKAGDDMVLADLDPSLLADATGQRWLRTRRPDLYGPLAVPTGNEIATRQSRMAREGEL
jgi:predicted amidohydrolase